jgi:hypothetical protein
MSDFFDDFDGIDCNDWMIIGPLAEEIAREKRDRDRAYRDMFGGDDDDPLLNDDDEIP